MNHFNKIIVFFSAIVFLTILVLNGFAGTTGKIAGQVSDKQLGALLKINRVQRTDRNLGQVVKTYSRPNLPAIHVSRQLLPSPILVRNLHKKVRFFKVNNSKSGTLATALLWAVAGREEVQFMGVREEDGFWIVEETLLDAIQKNYDNNLIIAIAA